jgi:hypothetical protein
MTEVLFCLSVGFVGYVIYVLVEEQMPHKPGVPIEPIPAVIPAKPRPTRKTATTKKKATPETLNLTSNAILAYLGKNGQTTIAKLVRELPENRKTIEDNIAQLILQGSITQTIIRRAKTVALKAKSP